LAKIFWDTNLFIYLFEEHPAFVGRVDELRRRMLARGDRLYTSALTVGEILVGVEEAAERYQAFFQSPAVTVVPFDLRAAANYGRIRQDRGIARPDAIQLACAAAAEMNLFVTNDDRLSRKVVGGIDFITSLELAPG